MTNRTYIIYIESNKLNFDLEELIGVGTFISDTFKDTDRDISIKYMIEKCIQCNKGRTVRYVLSITSAVCTLKDIQSFIYFIYDNTCADNVYCFGEPSISIINKNTPEDKMFEIIEG